MISRKAIKNIIKDNKEGIWRMAPGKFLADRRIGGVGEKSKIILLFGLDFTRLHQ